MIKQIFICDSCKKEIDNIYTIKIDMRVTSYFVRTYDLCNECRNKIIRICEGKEVNKDD